jgi:hypothetical protein
MDLSQAHAPVSEFLDHPDGSPNWQQFRLSNDQLASFNEQGYVAGMQVLNDHQVEILCAELNGLMKKSHPANHLFHEYHSNESNDPDAVLFHALGAWRTGPGCKPAHHGGVVAWHQDYSYWTRTEPMSHLTCWIALDDSDRDNGCLYYVPGSHRWKLLPRTGLTGNMDEIMTVLSPEQKAAFRPVPIELKRGQCTFHHPLMVHGSYANRSERPRRATLINAFRDGVQSAADEPLLQGVPPVPRGAKMQGQFFPLLFDPAALS